MLDALLDGFPEQRRQSGNLCRTFHSIHSICTTLISCTKEGLREQIATSFHCCWFPPGVVSLHCIAFGGCVAFEGCIALYLMTRFSVYPTHSNRLNKGLDGGMATRNPRSQSQNFRCRSPYFVFLKIRRSRVILGSGPRYIFAEIARLLQFWAPVARKFSPSWTRITSSYFCHLGRSPGVTTFYQGRSRLCPRPSTDASSQVF